METRPYIYDCVIVDDELDILLRRFTELNDVVDRFVVVEANITHSNKPKPLHFKDNLGKFDKFLHKVSHVVVDTFPTTDAWGIERFQRQCIMNALDHCKDNDVIIIADCDEIPTPEAIRDYRPDYGLQSFSMDLFYYDEHTKGAEKWLAARIGPYSLLKKHGPNGFRYLPESGLSSSIIPNAGKHLSYFGGVDAIVHKLESYSHREYDNPYFKDRERIAKAIANGTDLFGRDIKFEKV